MAATMPDLQLLHDVGPWASSLLAFVLGKATRDGADRAELAALRHDVSKLKQARIDQGATLAAHTAMHEAYVRTMGSMSDSLQKVRDDVSFVRGQLDSPKNRS